MVRVESNHARGSFQQLRLALLGRTCILYSLYYQIEVIKSTLEVRPSHCTAHHVVTDDVSLALDEHQLTMAECLASTGACA